MAYALTRQETVEMMGGNPSDRRLSRRRLGRYKNIIGPAVRVTSCDGSSFVLRRRRSSIRLPATT